VELSYLYEATCLPLTLQVLDSSSIPSDFQTANSSLSKGETVFVQLLNEKTIAGYVLFKDVYGKPILILRFDMPRDFYVQGQASVIYVIFALATVGVIFGGVIMLLLEQFVLSRLSKFIEDIRKIGKSGDFKARISVAGKDELSSLGNEVNQMLSTLQKSSEQLRQITDNMFDMISFTDVNGVHKYVSPSISRTLGYKPHEILGRTIFDFIHPEDLDKVRETVQNALQTRTPTSIECRFRHADGHYLWLEGTGNFIFDDNGQIVGAVLSSRDITERKKVEAALLESQQKFERLFKSNPEAAVFVDVDDRVLDINPRFTELFDYSSEEAVGKMLNDLIVPEDKQEEAEKLTRESMTGYIYVETVRKRKDGSLIPVLMSAAPITIEDQFIGCIVLYADITERKKMEEQLRQSEERFRSIAETSFNAILNLDLEGYITYISAVAETIIGYKPEEIAGKNFRSFLTESEIYKVAQPFIEVMNGKSIRGLELELRRKDGSLVPVEINSSPIVKDGKIVGVQAAIRDITERKQMEQELRDSEEKFRAISTSAKDAIVLMDDEGRISYWNPAAEKTFGYAKEEIIGKLAFETIIPKRFHEAMSKEVEIFRETGTGEVIGKLLELTAIRRDGTEFPIELSISTFRMKGKWHSLGIVRDITVRKQMEQKILESEERLRLFIEYAPDAIYINDLNGKILDGNKQAETLTGYKKEEIMGKNMFEAGLLPQRYLSKAAEALEKNIRGEKTGPDEFELTRKDGSLVVVEISTFPVTRAGKVEVIGIARDITERKKIEEALKESQELYKTLFESANDSLLYLDASGRIVDVNEKAVQTFGGSKEELLGKHFAQIEVLSPEDLPKLLNVFTRIVEGKESYLDLLIRNKKGEERYLECSSSILKTASKTLGVLVIARDVTERNNMQRKLQEYSQQLETIVEQRTRQLKETLERLVKSERLATIGQVAAMVGHDLRNPLTGINSAAYYLKTKLGPKMDHKIREMLELIEKDVQYSNKIITDLMEYSREIKLELTETTPKSILKDAISLVEIPKSVQVIDTTQNEPVMKVDIEKMRRVFSNFIRNAVEAMPEGGKLTISSKKSNGDVEIMFVDTGTGMAKEVLEKLWTPFFTTKAKGMGLGLAICRRIIEAHGGRISVESIAGEGTTFTVIIPVEPKPMEEGGEKVWVNIPESLLSTTTKP
jgi:two-component system sporulation sensor kinase A